MRFILIYSKSLKKMKTTTNKFDYPTASSQCYKIYKSNATKQVDPAVHKIKYREFDKQQREIERSKVQQEKQRKDQRERRENKKKLQDQLQRKKQQLLQLQKMKNMALEAEKKSQELAVIRQEEQRIMKLEHQRKTKENQFNAHNRFLEALRRLEDEKDINSKKDKQALFRRKVIEQTQKLQRDKAIKFRQQWQEKEKAYQAQQKPQFTSYKQPLGRTAYNKTVDYTKTYLHNPSIIVPPSSYDLQETALDRADRQNSREKEKSLQRKAREEQYKKNSLERGRIAMEKIAREREYQLYVKKQEEKARVYNQERIQAGKKNSYVGLKPGTLVQMEMNKRLRGEQQFQQMFFGGQNPQWFDRPANRYNIIQNKLNETQQNASANPKTRPVPARSIGSMGAVVSDSHYSFQSQSINDLTSVKKEHEQQLASHPAQQKRKVIPLPKQMTEDSPKHMRNVGQHNIRGTQSRAKEDLSYSQSQDDE